MLQQRGPDARRLALGMDEELGELEEAAALDGSGVADGLARAGVLGDPPLRGVLGQVRQQGLQARPHDGEIGVPGLSMARRQVADGRHEDVEGGARVGGRAATQSVGLAHRSGEGSSRQSKMRSRCQVPRTSSQKTTHSSPERVTTLK